MGRCTAFGRDGVRCDGQLFLRMLMNVAALIADCASRRADPIAPYNAPAHPAGSAVADDMRAEKARSTATLLYQCH